MFLIGAHVQFLIAHFPIPRCIVTRHAWMSQWQNYFFLISSKAGLILHRTTGNEDQIQTIRFYWLYFRPLNFFTFAQALLMQHRPTVKVCPLIPETTKNYQYLHIHCCIKICTYEAEHVFKSWIPIIWD